MNYMTHSRHYTTQHALSEEHHYLPKSNYLFDLDYLSVIQVDGEKASDFLQGQLSCDLRAITMDRMQQGLMCNLKGRIMAILDVVLMSNQSVGLVAPTDLSDNIQNALAKPAALSRVQLHQATLKLYGLFVQNKTDSFFFERALPEERYGVVHTDKGCCYKIDESYYICMIEPETADTFCAPFISQKQYRGSLAWQVLQLQHHRVNIYPESRGLFLPHRLDMHLSGYINFEKGCYKGQEIIARMHYRSTQKYKLVHFILDTEVELKAELSVYAQDGQTVVGEVIDYALIKPHQYIIVASVLISHKGSYTLITN